MMTRRDFVALAAIISHIPNSGTKEELIRRVGELAYKSNKRFHFAKFYYACRNRLVSCLNHKDCTRPYASRMKNGKIVRDKNTPCRYEA